MVWTTIHDVATDAKKDSPCAPPHQLIAANADTYLDHASELDINSNPGMVRLTGIVCTIGPSSNDPVILEKMMESGMNIARLNFSHGTHAIHAEEIKNIRLAAESYGKKLGMVFPVGIALDIKGPEIRLGYLEGGPAAEIELKKGEQIKLTTDKAYYEKGSSTVLYIDYDNINRVVHMGRRVYLDDGLISLLCTNVQGSVLTCTVEVGGILGSCKGVNLPGVEIDLPVVSVKDREDILFGLDNEVDMIFASYVRQGSAIAEIRDVLGPQRNKIMVIAKIENQEGMKNLDEIIKAADGIMVGRGDLGIELPVEKLFLAQKCIIAKCNMAGKPVICANQMIESMTKKTRPTRAECTDVANAVLDGADCVMLTSESAKGDYPVESIQAMAKICKEAEAAVWHKSLFIELVNIVTPPLDPSHAIAIAAVEVASKCLAAAIIVITTSGKSAFMISRYRPSCPIIAVSRNVLITRQAHLYKGVLPLVYTVDRMDDWVKDVEIRISFGISFGKWKGFIRSGDPVVAINGSRKGSGYTDTLRILYVTKPPEEGEPCGCVIR